MRIYKVLSEDAFVNEHVDVNKHIKFNEYPETKDMNDVYIIIDEIDDTLPVEFADNDNMALSYIVQIDVYTKVKTGVNARKLRNVLSYHISRLMWTQLGMSNVSNARPEYDRDFRLYRSARRYEGIFYKNKGEI